MKFRTRAIVCDYFEKEIESETEEKAEEILEEQIDEGEAENESVIVFGSGEGFDELKHSLFSEVSDVE